MRESLAAAAAALSCACGASADIVIAQDNSAMSLANALLGSAGDVSIVGAQLYHPWGNDSMSSGTFHTTGASNTYGMHNSGMSGGVVLSTGNVSDYQTGPNSFVDKSTAYGVSANHMQDALLVPVSGEGDFFDVTELVIQFNVSSDIDLLFQAVFGSEEFPITEGSPFTDGFAMYLNGYHIGMIDGQFGSVNHPWMAPVAGTELDGVLQNPDSGGVIHTMQGLATSSHLNYLHIIIGDKGNDGYDSTLWLKGLQVPAPSALALLGAAGLLGHRRRRR